MSITNDSVCPSVIKVPVVAVFLKWEREMEWFTITLISRHQGCFFSSEALIQYYNALSTNQQEWFDKWRDCQCWLMQLGGGKQRFTKPPEHIAVNKKKALMFPLQWWTSYFAHFSCRHTQAKWVVDTQATDFSDCLLNFKSYFSSYFFDLLTGELISCDADFSPFLVSCCCVSTRAALPRGDQLATWIHI